VTHHSFDKKLATKVLYQFYIENRKKNLNKLISDFPVKIEIVLRADLKDKQAFIVLWDDHDFIIKLPAITLGLNRYFLVCHELGHAIFKLNGISHVGMGDGYWLREAWCESFAVAMVLALFDINVFENYKQPFLFFNGYRIPAKQEKGGVNRSTARMICKFYRNSKMPELLVELVKTFGGVHQQSLF
jgi:hypothetical protein